MSKNTRIMYCDNCKFMVQAKRINFNPKKITAKRIYSCGLCGKVIKEIKQNAPK